MLAPRASKQARTPGTGWLRPGLLLGVVLVVAAAFTIPALFGEFVSDDLGLIVNNPQLAARSPAGLFTHRFASGAATAYRLNVSYYRPLTSLSFWFDRHLWGLHPFPFHLHNLLLNLVSVALAFLILDLLLASPVAAALGSLLFALHPMHAEPIAYISGRTDLLMTVFALGAFYLLLLARRRADRRFAALAVPAFGLSLLAKETAAVFPVFCLAWFVSVRLRRPRPESPKSGPRENLDWAILAALTVVTAGYLAARTRILGPGLRLTPNVRAGEFPALMLNTLGLYVRLFFAPFRHQPYFETRAEFLALTGYVLPALLLIAAAIASQVRPRDRMTGLGLWWGLLFLAPVLNLLFLSGPSAAERFLYAPSFGLVWLVVAALHRLVRGRRRPAIALSIAGLAGSVAMGAGLATTIPVWHNDMRIAEARVRTAPDFPMAHNSLGVAFKARNEIAAAGEEFARAVALNPDYAEAHNNLATIKETQGDIAGAIAEYRLAVRCDSSYVLAHNNLGAIFGAHGEADSAITQFQVALRFDPNNAEAFNNLGVAHYSQGRMDLARRELSRSLELRPDYTRALVNLVRVELADGNQGDAQRLFEQARRISPQDPGVLGLARQFQVLP
jgi:Tfp pilus assembly protein PilF